MVKNMTEDDLKELQGLVTGLKMRELFEEPSDYEDEEDDDGYWMWSVR